MPHVNKKSPTRNGKLIQTKQLSIEQTMKGLGKFLLKKTDPKNK